MSPHSARVIVSRTGSSGETEVLLVKCLPAPTHPEDEVFYEIPGGDCKGKEIPEETAKRETREETGLKIRKSTPLALISMTELPNGHVRYAFHVERVQCRGKLFKPEDAHDDGDKRIVGNAWVPINQALKLIVPRAGMRSQHDILDAFRDYLGIETR